MSLLGRFAIAKLANGYYTATSAIVTIAARSYNF
jgi:hypothetical protein